MNSYVCITSTFYGDDCEPFRTLLPDAQVDAKICGVECMTTTFAAEVSVAIRFIGRRSRDGQPYARPVNHYARLVGRDWLLLCYPDARVRGTVSVLLREAGASPQAAGVTP